MLLAAGLGASACRPGPPRHSGPQRTSELRAQWEALLACRSAADCLAASEGPKYVLDADLARMAGHLASFGPPAAPLLAAAAEDASHPRRRELADRALLEMGAGALEWARETDDERSFSVLARLALHTGLVVEVRPLLVARLPRHRPWLLGQLRYGPTVAAHNVGLAVVRLVGQDGRQELEALCPLLDGQGRLEWELAQNLAEAMGRTGAVACAPALTRALTLPSWRVTSSVLESLARLGVNDPEVRRAVLRVATSHWSQRIRWRAVTTLRFLHEPAPFDEPAAIERAVQAGGTLQQYLTTRTVADDPVGSAFATHADSTADGEGRPECALGRVAGAPVPVRGPNGTVLLQPLASGTPARLEKAAARLPRGTLAALGIGLDVTVTQAARDAVPLDGSLIVAACAGDRGGGMLELPGQGVPRPVRRGCFERLMPVETSPQTLWAFEGSSHFGADYGRIWRLRAGPQGVELRPVVDLPAGALAVGRSGASVLVATERGDVSVEPDGSLSPLACAPP